MMDYYVKINYDIKTKLVNTRQFYTIPLPDWIYSRLIEKLELKPTQISELNTETFEGVYKPVNICPDILLTDNQLPSINRYKLTTNNCQQNINTCEYIGEKLKSEK
ncbi:hypothetical protein C6497_03315 [Candidatus Poribacteria bacterium]|nr:MAG: hypothetical protein C6497_03315 [Candidatus Poribacteria bacterium]